MKLVVTGSRDWTSREVIRRALHHAVERMGDIAVLAHGACRGADVLAAQVALEYGFVPAEAIRAFPAEDYGPWPACGPIRNRAMLDAVQPDLVVAFHDDLFASRGTHDCICAAQERHLTVYLWSSRGMYTEL